MSDRADLAYLVPLVNADARALPLRAGVAQTIITSPPYPGMRDYEEPRQIGRGTLRDYCIAMRAALVECHRVLRPDGICWLVLGAVYRDKRYVDVAGLVAREAERVGFVLRQRLIWAKAGAMPETVHDRFVQTHEDVLLLVKHPTGYLFNVDILRQPHQPASLRRAAWEKQRISDQGVKSQSRQGKVAANRVRLHPKGHVPGSVLTFAPARFKAAHFAVMPDALAAYLILASTRPGDLVLDSFAGSATVVAVAQALGRRAVGVDLNHRYLNEIARVRLTAGGEIRSRPQRVTPTRRRIQKAASLVVPVARSRGRHRSDSDHLSQRQQAAQQGVSRDTQWKSERLARDFPGLHAHVVAGEMSVHAAAVEAGFLRRRRTSGTTVTEVA